MNLPPDHVPAWVELPHKGDFRIQLKMQPEVCGRRCFFWISLIVMLWGFPGFRRAIIKKFEKHK